MNKIKHSELKFISGVDRDLVDLLTQMLKKNYEDRILMTSLIKYLFIQTKCLLTTSTHPWITRGGKDPIIVDLEKENTSAIEDDINNYFSNKNIFLN